MLQENAAASLLPSVHGVADVVLDEIPLNTTESEAMIETFDPMLLELQHSLEIVFRDKTVDAESISAGNGLDCAFYT